MEPLDCYENLINWRCPNDKSECCTINFSERKLQENIGLPINYNISSKRNKVLCCHDMCGGYLDDNILQGNSNVYAYRFYQWDLIDTFIYFSHHFVTIPPIGWTQISHINGVQCLGTLIIEPGERCDNFEKIFASNNFELVAVKLDEIRKFYNFDGWLINLECFVKEPSTVNPIVNNICQFLNSLRNAGNEVIWYDAITDHGNLNWQNALNDRNCVYFNHCGKIFTNYTWNTDLLDLSLVESKGHGNNVYVGIDCYGRGCPGNGKFNCIEALNLINDASSKRSSKSDPKLSIALFAQAWCYAELPEDKRPTEQNVNIWRFFHLINTHLLSSIEDRNLYRQLPEISLDNDTFFDTCFDLGQGLSLYKNGKMVDNIPYNNLLNQQVTPSTSFSFPNDEITVKFLPCREFSYTGYSCMEMVTDFISDGSDTAWPISVEIFRLGCKLPRHNIVTMKLWLGLKADLSIDAILSGLKLSLTFSIDDSEVKVHTFALDKVLRPDSTVVTPSVNWHYFLVDNVSNDLNTESQSVVVRKIALDIANKDTLHYMKKASLYFGRITIGSSK